MKFKKVTIAITLAVLFLLAQMPSAHAGNLYVHLSFDGTDDYVEVASDPSLNVSGGSMTVEFWAKTDSLTEAGGTTFSKSASDWSTWYYCMFLDYSSPQLSEIEWMLADSPTTYVDVYYEFDYNDGFWHHYLMSFDSADDSVELWADGVNQSVTYTHTTGSIGSYDSDGDLYLGAQADSPVELFQEMEMDEFRVYSRLLTQAEITYSFNNKEPQNQTGLVMWLRMNEGTGDTVYDETANNNDGTLMPSYPSNAPLWVDETPPPPATPPAPKSKHKPSANEPLPPWVDPRNLSAVFLFILLLVYAYTKKH